nr:MAG TPA: hypothetical protein [Caudoviricetes sp.]
MSYHSTTERALSYAIYWYPNHKDFRLLGINDFPVFLMYLQKTGLHNFPFLNSNADMESHLLSFLVKKPKKSCVLPQDKTR